MKRELCNCTQLCTISSCAIASCYLSHTLVLVVPLCFSLCFFPAVFMLNFHAWWRIFESFWVQCSVLKWLACYVVVAWVLSCIFLSLNGNGNRLSTKRCIIELAAEGLILKSLRAFCFLILLSNDIFLFFFFSRLILSRLRLTHRSVHPRVSNIFQ